MYTNDLISDSLARIRNAIMRNREEVVTPASKLVRQVMEILKSEGFIESFSDVEIEGKPALQLNLKYVDGISAIRELKRVSKPGIRNYVGYRDLKRVRSGQGIAIVSTSKGVMTAHQARQQKVGGEVICEIW